MARFKFLQYRLLQRGNEAYNADLTGPVQVPAQYRDTLLHDLSDLHATPVQGALESELHLDVDGTPVVVARDLGKQEVQYRMRGQGEDAEFVWLPDEIVQALKASEATVLLDAQQISTDYLAKLFQPFASDSAQTLETVRNGFGDNAVKLLEAEVKLMQLEHSLQQQRKADEAQLTSSELESNLKDVDARLEAVSGLIKQEQAVAAKLQQYAGLLGTDVEQRAAELRAQAAQIRTDTMISAAKTGKSPAVAAEPVDNAPKGIRALWLLIFPAVTLVVGVVASLIMQQPLAWWLAVIATIVQAVLFVILNRLPLHPEVLASPEVMSGGLDQAKPTPVVASGPAEVLASIVKFFTDKAWLGVLQHEAQQLRTAIAQRLQGAEYSQVQQARSELKQELEKLAELIKAYNQQELTPEAYLRRRREVDMLKVDKARLEGELRSHPQALEFEDLRSKYLEIAEQALPGAAKQPQAFVSEVLGEYGDVQIQQNGVALLRPDNAWDQFPVSDDRVMALVVWKFLAGLEKSSATQPIILADMVRAGFSAYTQGVINAKLDIARQRVQVVLVTTIA